MQRIIAGALALVTVLGAAIAQAQDVTLTARDGGLALSGQLISYDGEFYRIESLYGGLTIAAEGVICDGPACPELTAPLVTIRIAGATGIARKLLPDLFAGFAASRGLIYTAGEPAEIRDPKTGQPLARIAFLPVTPDQAIAMVLAREAELALGFDAAPALRNRAIALDALVPAVAAENQFPAMRSDDLLRALTGEVDNWQSLGGPDMPIVVHALSPDAPLAASVSARIGAMIDGPRHADGAALAAAVARDPWALALIGRAELGQARGLTLTDSCDFPLPATDLTIKAEDYPLTVPLYLSSARRRQPLLLREFMEYLATDAAQTAVATAGFVDRRLGYAPLADDGQRLLGAIRNTGSDVTLAELQRLAAAMTGGDRLSLTFRFQDGSAQLDAHSNENLADLARHIASGRFSRHRLVLAGFSDGTGAADVNLALSRSRAEAVRAALQALAPDLTAEQLPGIEAFGEALPMACDTTATGRQINRRVELWMFPEPTAAP